jgi:hypothetical protein
MPTGLRSYSVRVAELFFVTVAVFAVKSTLPNTYGAAAGIVLWPSTRNVSSLINGKVTVGGVLTVPPIHAALVKRLGRDIPMSTTYRLLARHNWRKVQPDTKHPKSDPALQGEF